MAHNNHRFNTVTLDLIDFCWLTDQHGPCGRSTFIEYFCPTLSLGSADRKFHRMLKLAKTLGLRIDKTCEGVNRDNPNAENKYECRFDRFAVVLPKEDT